MDAFIAHREGSLTLPLFIFDLDGTLIDSSRDLAISTNAMLQHMNRPEIDEQTVNSYVGDGAAKLVRRALGDGATEDEIEAAYKFFIRYYRDHSLENTHLYDGIEDVLHALQQSGSTLAVLTNKPVKISRDILNGLHVGGYFAQVYGGDSFSAKKPDPVGIETIMKETSFQPEATTMIGDTNVDTKTARAAGVRACGVTWGFKPATLNDPPVDILARDVRHLPELLLEEER